ncbi:hypothetical protein IV203_028654 [Nitzschia inconspicua]|uniref:Uncharacterized protein n=1 Tax=Nitzschia inconspicua TaxID=303405 RepID=A0A9K3Q2F4_9STRA|nr:hypothetical protein IV203_028654 [Nitzschia inconspicua]
MINIVSVDVLSKATDGVIKATVTDTASNTCEMDVSDSKEEKSTQFNVPIFYSLDLGLVNNTKTIQNIQYDQMVDQLGLRNVEWHQSIYINGREQLFHDIPNRSEVAALPPRDDFIVLHRLWEFCHQKTHGNSWVVFLTSQDLSIDPQKSAQLLRIMTKGALSKECSIDILPEASMNCNVCSTRFSPFPYPHSPSNIWSAQCSYIQELVDPLMFDTQIKTVNEMSPYTNQENKKFCGSSEQAAAHWVYSHPRATPCDLHIESNFQWTTQPGPFPNLRSDDLAFLLKAAPRFPLAQWRDDGCFNADQVVKGFALNQRRFEYQSIYPDVSSSTAVASPSPLQLNHDWWGWKLWTDTDALAKFDWNQSLVAQGTDITWVPVPESRRMEWNASRMVPPLHHCILGGCRRGGQHLQSTAALFLEPTRSGETVFGLSNILEELHTSKLRDNPGHERVCTLWFVGDSTSSDTAIGAVCSLISGLGFKLVRCRNDIIGAQWYGADNTYCQTMNLNDPHMDSNLTTPVAYFDLEREASAGPCPKTRIKFTWGDSKRAGSMPLSSKLKGSTLPDEYGLVLPGWGVHCNDGNCMREYMKNIFQPALSALPTKKYHFFWREHEPQHFANNPGGIFYPGGRFGDVCGPLPNESFDNFRNGIAEEFLTSNHLVGNGDNQVRGIVRIFEALKPIWGLHNQRKNDCTHYCFSPWRLELTWDGIYRAMRGETNS